MNELDLAFNQELIPPEVIEPLIYQESKGDPEAVGDKGKSLGLGQMQKIAWKDTTRAFPELTPYPYKEYVKTTDVGPVFIEACLNSIPILYRKKGEWSLKDILGTYNLGPTSARKYNYDYEKFPKKVKTYVDSILKRMQEQSAQ